MTRNTRIQCCCRKQQQQQPSRKTILLVPRRCTFIVTFVQLLLFFRHYVSNSSTSAFIFTKVNHFHILLEQKHQQRQQKQYNKKCTIPSLSSSPSTLSTALHLSNKNKNKNNNFDSRNSASSTSTYDVTKPMFDLYSLRSVRGDALTRYNTLNQSEPLRINILLFVLFVCICAPHLAEEVNGIAFVPIQYIGTSIIALLSGYFLQQQCTKRSIQILNKMV